MSFKLIFGITVCTSLVGLSNQKIVNGDYIPMSRAEAAYPSHRYEQEEKNEGAGGWPLQEMTDEQMENNRLTKHYEDFVNGAFVNMVELVTYPLVR